MLKDTNLVHTFVIVSQMWICSVLFLLVWDVVCWNGEELLWHCAITLNESKQNSETGETCSVKRVDIITHSAEHSVWLYPSKKFFASLNETSSSLFFFFFLLCMSVLHCSIPYIAVWSKEWCPYTSWERARKFLWSPVNMTDGRSCLLAS